MKVKAIAVTWKIHGDQEILSCVESYGNHGEWFTKKEAIEGAEILADEITFATPVLKECEVITGSKIKEVA